ncbi:MAG: glycosyltransferase [Janthinobacterium lividum]
MARILIATIGSLGDLHPYLAVALGMQARGHGVTIATNRLHRSRVEGAGLPWADLRPEAPDHPAPELMARAMDPVRGPRFVFETTIAPAIRDQVADLLAASPGMDLLVSTPLSLGVPLAAERLGLPWASAVLQPMGLFSATDPPVPPQIAWAAPLQRLGWLAGAPLRFAAHRVMRRWGRPVRALRREMGLSYRADPLGVDGFSPLLNLAMFSPLLARPQRDWPPGTRQTGFAFYDAPDPDSPPAPELETFLQGGPAPVVFTLGSAAVHAARAFYRDSLEAARMIGRRALLLTSADPQGLPDPLPDWALAVPYAPHAAVFPRACAVVHQGGAGTTGQALRAGRPMLMVPFAHDQPDNAARMQRAGLARVLPIGSYTADRAAASLRALLADGRMAAQADLAGRQIRAEDGVRSACDALESVLTPRSTSPAPA